MPINTVQQFLRGLLDGLPLNIPGVLPDTNVLNAFITPPNPNDDARPGAYIWGAHGDEKRLAVPRAQPGQLSSGGDKQATHNVSIWLVWFGPGADPDADQQFPSIIDAVIGCLRNAQLHDAVTQLVSDPLTGQQSALLDVGENMSWEYAGVRATADQRYLRFDAIVTVDIVEIFQA